MKKFILLLLLCLLRLSQNYVYGQACIKAYDVATGQEISTFCVNQQVRFKSCNPDSRPDLEYYDFDKSNGLQIDRDTTKFFTYTSPGTDTVTQVINTGAKGIHQGERVFTVLPAPRPKFLVTGCGRRNVKVTITDKTYDSYQVSFGGGAPLALARGASATHQFASGQAMRVVVTARYTQARCAISADTTVQELPLPAAPLLASIQLLVPAPQGRMNFTLDQLQTAHYYIIERQAGAGFTPIDTIKNPSATQMVRHLDKLDTQTQGCFRIRVTDPCGTDLGAVSHTICSLPLALTSTQGIQLSWPAYPNSTEVKGYQLFRDGRLLRDFPGSQSSFLDESVTCQQQYCYELRATLHNNGLSVSNNPCGAVLTAPPPAKPYLSSSFTPGNQVRIRFLVPPGQVTANITYQKSTDGAAFQTLSTTAADSLDDETFKTGSASCYQVFYQDSCGQASPLSNQTCPILLTVAQQENNNTLLSWSDYVGFPAGASYAVQKLDAQGKVVASIPVSGNTYSDVFKPDAGQSLFYRIQASTTGLPPTYSNSEKVAFEPKIQIPTAFTPNGDNLNDVFEVKGRFIQVTRLTIYDRWGQVLFLSEGPGWDGRIKGQLAPPGTYPYSITWQDEDGRLGTSRGTVTLLH